MLLVWDLCLCIDQLFQRLGEVAGDFSVFGENQQVADKFISEDVSFFRKLKSAGIPVYAHTGAHVQHLKTFSFDVNYYHMYWSGVAEGKLKREARSWTATAHPEIR
jgi:acetyl esterase/lipase